MSSIGSIGNNSTMTMQMQAMKRPDPSEMAANLFAQLDTSGQGYLDKSTLQAAFDNISSASGSGSGSTSTSTTSVDGLFSKLDSDGDGKVTKQELTDTLSKVAAQLDQQFMNMRMQGGIQGGGGMPPPPPPGGGNNAGFTQDELSTQLKEIGSGDSKRADLIGSIVKNFSAADSDGDGKVSMKEAMAYDQTRQGGTASSSTNSTSSSASTASSSDLSDELLRQIMQLMQAYRPDDGNGNTKTSSLSVSA